MTDPAPSPASAPEPRILPRRALDAVAGAVRFFTRVPVPAGWGAGAGFGGIATASPLAGALVGAGAGGVLIVALALGLPSGPAAVAAVAAAVALSGALHLDGLADVADGFGGGATRERKLEIMRDSRLGTFGGAALALALLARVSLVAALADHDGASATALALIAAAMLARPLAFLPTLALGPARPDGLGQSASPGSALVVGALAAAASAVVALKGAPAGISALALSLAAAAAVIAIARRQIGGHTGDVCGATAEVAEIAALAALLAAAS